MTIDVRKCSVAEIFDDPASARLIAEYAEECADKRLKPVAPRRDIYENLEAMEMAQCFRCQYADELFGFALVLLSPSAHNGETYATVESLFVGKEYRALGAGTALMQTIEDAARNAGCEEMFYTAHVGSQLARLLFLSSDLYENTCHVFRRRLQ